MNKQRKVLITTTYNELGIIIDTKTEEVQLATDTISRQAAIDALAKHEKSNGHNYTLFVDIVSECAEIIRDLPSAQPEIIRCGECKNYIDGRCIIANHHTSVMDNCGSVMGAERREDG